VHEEALLRSLDHRLGCANLRLTNGARGFHIDGHPEVHIEEAIVGVGKERAFARSAAQ
jgi:hypothetical protein